MITRRSLLAAPLALVAIPALMAKDELVWTIGFGDQLLWVSRDPFGAIPLLDGQIALIEREREERFGIPTATTS